MGKNKVGLALGCLFASIHLVWALLIAIIPNALQACLDWMFEIHGLEPIWIITSMTLANAILLVVVTFIFGYILGWLFELFFSDCKLCHKQKRRR